MSLVISNVEFDFHVFMVDQCDVYLEIVANIFRVFFEYLEIRRKNLTVSSRRLVDKWKIDRPWIRGAYIFKFLRGKQ